MTVLFDIIPLIASLVVGILTELFKQKMAYNHANRQAEIAILKATQASVVAARKYETPHTSKVRKALVIIIAIPFLFPVLLEVANWVMKIWWLQIMPHTPWMPGIDKACIYIPERIIQGGLLSWIWSEDKVQYAEVCGFVMFPIYIYSWQVVVGFYFGQAGAKVRVV